MSIIDNNPFVVIFSSKNISDSIGTNMYPSDSNIGISFKPIPALIAYMLMTIEDSVMQYATNIRQSNNAPKMLVRFFSADALRST